MERKSYTVAVDLGSSHVVVAVGERQPDGAMEVACIVSKPVEGVRAGMIENIELVSHAIRDAVSEVEEQLGIRITEAYAGISGEFVRCARHTDHVFVYDPQNGVNQKDVDALFDRMRNVQAPEDEVIMERVPLDYVVDDTQLVKNPVGSFGRKLSSTFNFVLCQKTPMQRLDMALRRLGISMIHVVPDALATPEAVLLPDEKEEGVAVVDIGGGLTDVTVYYGNVVRYIATIPMGASAINRDIRTLSVPEKHVESLKLKYGSAVAELAPEDKLIRVAGRTPRDTKDILIRNLATAIEARATDIVEFVLQEIKDSGYADKLVYGIVLTGGSAKLKDLDELFRRVTGMDVRVAEPDTGITEESKASVADPACATVLGILLKGSRIGPCVCVERPAPRPQPAAPQPAPQPQMRPAAPSQPFGQRAAVVPPQPSEPPQPQPAPRQPVQPTQMQRPLGPQPFTPPQPESPQPAPRPFAPMRPADAEERPEAGDAAYARPESEPEAESPHFRQPDEEPDPEPRRRKRDWGSLIQNAFEKLNKSFTEHGDDEIL